jgi:transposase InsO family protein
LLRGKYPPHLLSSLRLFFHLAPSSEQLTYLPTFCLISKKTGHQDTFYVGTLKGVGRIYQQTFIDTYSKMAFAKLYDRKTPLTAADLLNDRVLPFFEEHEIVLSRVLTDRGTEYCGTDSHEYELYPAVEAIDHTRLHSGCSAIVTFRFQQSPKKKPCPPITAFIS